MPAPTRMRISYTTRSAPAGSPRVTQRTEFYREEFVKHRLCLERQREYYSERAIADVEKALTKIIAGLEKLSAAANADEVVSRLLHQFDVVTGLSNWTDPPNLH
jgi:hypothetical protein